MSMFSTVASSKLFPGYRVAQDVRIPRGRRQEPTTDDVVVNETEPEVEEVEVEEAEVEVEEAEVEAEEAEVEAEEVEEAEVEESF